MCRRHSSVTEDGARSILLHNIIYYIIIERQTVVTLCVYTHVRTMVVIYSDYKNILCNK